MRGAAFAAGIALAVAAVAGCAHDAGDPSVHVGEVYYFARFTPPLTDHGALARLVAASGDATHVRDTFVTEPESIRPGARFTVEAPRAAPRSFVPLLKEPALRRARNRFEGHDVWTYGTGYVICEDAAPAIVGHGPLHVRRIVHVASAPATVGIGPAGYLNGENPTVQTQSPYIVFFDPPAQEAAAPRTCTYQWTFADLAALDTTYSLESFAHAQRSWSAAVRAEVAAGRVTPGMTRAMVAWSIGFPAQAGTRDTLMREAQWTYPRPAGDVNVTFRNDRVVE